MDWLDELDKIIDEFICRSHIEELYGKLETAPNKLQAGYTNGLTILNRPWYFMICWHEYISPMGICVKFSARAWATYRQDYEAKYQSKMNVVEFLKMVQSDRYDMRLSRIDLTADYIDYPNPLTPNTELDPDDLFSPFSYSGRFYLVYNSVPSAARAKCLIYAHAHSTCTGSMACAMRLATTSSNSGRFPASAVRQLWWKKRLPASRYTWQASPTAR